MNAAGKKPEIVVFAGPNGSGKSTITNLLRPVEMPYINADDIQRVLGCDNLEAAKLAEAQRESHLEQKKSFCFEDVCHIYDNSTKSPYRIFKKRKELCWYCTQRYLWHKEDIVALTGVENVQKAALN